MRSFLRCDRIGGVQGRFHDPERSCGVRACLSDRCGGTTRTHLSQRPVCMCAGRRPAAFTSLTNVVRTPMTRRAGLRIGGAGIAAGHSKWGALGVTGLAERINREHALAEAGRGSPAPREASNAKRVRILGMG